MIASTRPALRGLRPWHVRTLLVREPGDLSLDHRRCAAWPASGRRRAEADDARAGEVRPCRSSGEAGEQARASGCGAGGAKGRGRGERGSGRHAPDTGPGERVPRPGPRAASGKGTEEGKVHRAPAPCRRRPAPIRLSRTEAGSGGRGGRRDLARLRRRPRAQARGPARPYPPGSVSGATVAAAGTFRSRTAACARLASRRWKTRSSSGRSSRC